MRALTSAMVILFLVGAVVADQPVKKNQEYVELKPLKKIISDSDYNEEQKRRTPGVHKCVMIPKGWDNIYESDENEWCNRSIENMYRPGLGEPTYRFYLYEIQNKRHTVATRSNMASALILHRFASGWGVPNILKKMAQDKTESELWKTYCLRYLDILNTLATKKQADPHHK